jgi:flagellar protein FlaG
MNDIKTNSSGNSLPPAKVVSLRPESSSPSSSGTQAPVSQSGSVTPEVAARQAAVSTQPAEAERSVGKQAQQQQEKLKEAVTRLNEYVQSVQRDLAFEMHGSSGKTVIKVVDRNTKEVVRQIPDEVVIRLAEKLQQDEPLTLFNIRV